MSAVDVTADMLAHRHPLMTRSGYAPADILDGFAAIRNSGLRIALRSYKAPNGNLNVTGGKRSPILNSCQPTVPGKLPDISQGAGSDDSVIADSAVRIVCLPNTANYEKPRRLTWAQQI
jgi:hypothetical protein